MIPPAPTPPEKALKRVLTLSRLNGWSVVIIAGLGVLLALLLLDPLGTAVGLLAAASGWMELRGHRQLRRRDPAGMKWLVRAQLFLLAVVLAYCTSRLGSFDAESMMSNLTPDMETLLKEGGIERADILPLVHKFFLAWYGGVALVCILYQGGLALYYRKKIPLVTAALATPPVPPPPA